MVPPLHDTRATGQSSDQEHDTKAWQYDDPFLVDIGKKREEVFDALSARKQQLLSGAQQVITPIDHAAQRALALRPIARLVESSTRLPE